MQIDATQHFKLEPTLARPTETHVARSSRKVGTRVVATENLTSVEIERMYSVFAKYYNNHSHEIFVRDLLEKDHVILLHDTKTKAIQGFSTLLKVDLGKYGINAIGFYSGDTVLEREYWGSKALGQAFLLYLWREKVKNPLRPVYWFLISKGYKTYLLMANNFSTHYPQLGRATPSGTQKIMDSFYGDRFGQQYNRAQGSIEFDDASCCVKEKVAAVSQELLKNERIRFFSEKNPKWELGWELACLAEMTLWMPFKYLLKKKTRR